MADLFEAHGARKREQLAPLADRMRPRTLEDFVGQEGILAPGRLLRRAISADRVGNLILHGPPGVGKTTLARIIAGSTRARFRSLNAVLAGVRDLRAEVDDAQRRLGEHGLRTILFIDEVHRFNAAQQDALLPWVENGTITLIGATTENPFFEVNKALVSRARLFRLRPLGPADLRRLLQRALEDPERGYGGRPIEIEPAAVDHWVAVAGGDARSLLNALELAVESTPADERGTVVIDLATAEDSIQQRAVLYDKQGDAHYDTISAFIKSLRGSDPDAALFWLARMIEAGEHPRFIFRRMLIAAGEDIGLADPMAVVTVEACAAAFERIGLPEGLYPLAQAALYLAGAEKSNSVLGFFDAVAAVRRAAEQDVPSHLRDGHRDREAFGDGVGYRYPHAYAEHWVAQRYLPAGLQEEVFWQPGSLGWEGALRGRLQQRRAAQLAAVAEMAAEQPLLLSHGPDDPRILQWISRQLAGEAERLQSLRQNLWQGAQWRRQDRVLLLGSRSLIWALDPLQHTPEGGVVLCCPDTGTRIRLASELELLDQLRRPTLVVAPVEDPRGLLGALETGSRFEWIAGRQALADLGPERGHDWLGAITALAAEDAEMRLLDSRPLLGPAGSLLLLRERDGGRRAAADGGAALQALTRIAAVEKSGLGTTGPQVWRDADPDRHGWRMTRSTWTESVALPMEQSLLGRWLAPGARYRTLLEGKGVPEADLSLLQQSLTALLGGSLPQRIEHRLIRAVRGDRSDSRPEMP